MSTTRYIVLIILIALLILIPVRKSKADAPTTTIIVEEVAEVPLRPVEVTKQVVVYAKKEKLIRSDLVEFQLLVEKEFANDPVMIKIAKYESTFNPSAKNSSSSASGLFQITKGTWKDYKCTGDVFNAEDNIACAKIIKADRGTQPWNASKSNWSK